MLKKRILATLIAGALSSTAFADLSIVTNSNVAVGAEALAPVSLVSNWDKTFAENANVAHQKVTFKNRYGISIVADLYYPKDLDPSRQYPAIAVSGPFGAIKEQSSGLYAQTLAASGFVTIAFDPSYTGESGGFPRNISSPDVNTEDFYAAVDFLGSQAFVNREQIGILGICGWGGFALSAASADTRVKAVATTVMYDMSRAIGYGMGSGGDLYGTEVRQQMKEGIATQRYQDFTNRTPAYMPNAFKGDMNNDPVLLEYASYYATERGFHERSINSNAGWALTNANSFINFPTLSKTYEITAPTLIVAGEVAFSRYFSEDAFKEVGAKNKELLIVPGANHVDLYDNVNKIPFAKLVEFYQTNLVK
ncbi:hypothetical protein CJP74_00190 [Psittacicella melopsittaci]|uniref:Xaa-Pro dipeptidyl-peptidase-like domain-containing protein n=2 Tax=Psittacicella melopsittaci TaxID=2028576 RepID=A0A3A1Y9N3_9GAMM|nr:alpha/beta hydrolase [Psittacicella melopsittaci]RIY34036.1 hypothetical protein CJP74_00190 [Psittacicella melopsittaci]